MWPRVIDSTLFAFVYVALLTAFVVAGYFIARKRYVGRNRKWTPSGVESSIIGFFALVISFTLSSAYTSARERNGLLRREGDAITQLYRESFTVSPALGANARAYLLQHMDSLLYFYRHDNLSIAGITRSVTTRNENFYAAVMKDTAQKKEFAKLSPYYNTLTSATSGMLYSFEERTPSVIMWLLILSSWFVGLLIGFMNGFYERTHLLVPLLYMLLATLTLKAIADLDNPLQGNIRPAYKNLEDLQLLLYKKTQ